MLKVIVKLVNNACVDFFFSFFLFWFAAKVMSYSSSLYSGTGRVLLFHLGDTNVLKVSHHDGDLSALRGFCDQSKVIEVGIGLWALCRCSSRHVGIRWRGVL